MGDPLRVMTFNIRVSLAFDGANRWYRRRDLVFDAIRHSRPHLVGIQEATSNQLDEILDALPGFGSIAHNRYAGRIHGSFAPILFDTSRIEASRSGDFWLGPDPGKRTRAWDAAVPRLCTWAEFVDRSSKDRFVVFNSHFDQRGEVARVESAKLVTTKLAELGHLPRLVTLDLNANETSEPLHIFTEAGFRDTFRDVHPAEKVFTFHAFRGARSKGRLGKIDFVLVDDRWTTVGAEVVRTETEGRLPSDHYPVSSDVVLTSANRG